MGRADLPTTMQGTSVFDGLLTQCRDLACAQLDEAIAGMLDDSEEELSELAVKSQDREAQKLYLAVRDVAKTQRETIAAQFRTRYLGEFQSRTNKAKKTGGNFADVDFSSLELSLVADDDLEETLKFKELAAKLRRYCEEEINALDQRVGVLLGDASLQTEDNPFSPQAICDAYKQTCRQVDANADVRTMFLKLFDDHVLDRIRAVYKAVNELLVQNAILPKIRYSAAKKDGGGKAAKWVKVEGDQVVGEAVGEQDLFATLQKLMASNAGALGGAGAGGTLGGPPLLAGAELLGSLTQLQLDGLAALGAGAALPSGEAVTGTTNILHELKGSSVGASMGQMDAMTLDIVARLFDQLFDDPKIPLGAKGLIGRLQIPMLKVAIADKELFSNKTHPARRLLDTLGEIAIRLPADFNTGSALFGHLETILQELTAGYKDEVDIFDLVRGQLIALMTREDQRIEEEARAAEERAMQEEALAVAKSAAQAEMGKRVQANPLPGAVLEFLIEQWLQLLMLIHAKRGTASDAWRIALESMDQLIWSVQPKETAEERRKLATTVPVLLKRIAAGLQVAGIGDDIRENFFAELMKTHTKIMSAPPKDAAAQPAAAPAAPLGFTANIRVRNPYGAGTVEVSELELNAAATSEPARYGRGAEAGLPDSLKPGDWVEFKEAKEGEKEERRPVRLIFISPRKTRYIFADRGEKEYIECTRSEITRRLRAGEATVMEEEPEVPFFERIMGGVVSKMRGAPAAA
jgi:hypothetical protein